MAQLAARGITGFNQDSPLTYVLATSTQGNSLNQDLNGVPKDYDGDATWASLGAQSNSMTPAGAPVPEPGTATLLLSMTAFGLTRTRIRKRGQPSLRRP